MIIEASKPGPLSATEMETTALPPPKLFRLIMYRLMVKQKMNAAIALTEPVVR